MSMEYKKAIEKYNLAKIGIVALVMMEPQMNENLADLIKKFKKKYVQRKKQNKRKKPSVGISN